MPRMTSAEQSEFLCTNNVLMRIATVGKDGAPHVTPSWFLYTDDSIVFTPRANARWFADLRSEPRVALCIDEDPLPYRKVTVEGTARILYEPGSDEVWRDTYRSIAGKYMDHNPDAVENYLQTTIDQPRGLVALVLSECKVRNWRMPSAAEPTSGIWHQRYYAEGSQLAVQASVAEGIGTEGIGTEGIGTEGIDAEGIDTEEPHVRSS